jgi:hypothetical protein
MSYEYVSNRPACHLFVCLTCLCVTCLCVIHMSLQGKRSVPSPGMSLPVVTDILNVVNVRRFISQR